MKEKRKFKKKIILIPTIIIFIILIIGILNYLNILPKKTYKASDFNIETIYSEIDFNNNEIDDYTDILNGAKIDANNHPTYDSSYYSTGYPPDSIGVCTDVIWRSFKNAGYSLRDMVDNDIKLRPDAYPNIERRDNNIDFRRVTNLNIFFKEYATNLTTDYNKIGEWQAGDIVIFNNNKHIGIISDLRNKKGIPYVIHNAGQFNREEDYLTKSTIIAHYRFDASLLDKNMLIEFIEE